MLKGNKLSRHEKTWSKLEYVMLSVKSQSEKSECWILHYTNYVTVCTDNTMEAVKGLVSGSQGKGRMNKLSTEDFKISKLLCR
jgi:hypothetical protein